MKARSSPAFVTVVRVQPEHNNSTSFLTFRHGQESSVHLQELPDLSIREAPLVRIRIRKGPVGGERKLQR